ncbi:hypothetical protein GZH46_02176, partial [Fragariocoptes setiger]
MYRANYDGTLIAFLSLLPTYFETMLHIDIQHNGMLNFYIQAAACVGIVCGGMLVNLMTKQFRWSGREARILVFGIAAFGAASMWLLPSAFPSNVVTLFILNRAFHPAIEICTIGQVLEQYSGSSGVMFGLHNTIAVSLTVLYSWPSGYVLDLLVSQPSPSILCGD